MGSIRVYKIFIDCLAPESARLIDRFRHKLSVILAQLADCPPNRLKTGKSIREGASLSVRPSAEVPDTKAHPLVYFISSGPGGAGRGQTIFPGPKGRGGGWKTIPCPGPEGQDGERLFGDTSPSWPSIGPMVPFRALWLHSGLRLAYGSVPAPFWPMVPFWAFG